MKTLIAALTLTSLAAVGAFGASALIDGDCSPCTWIHEEASDTDTTVEAEATTDEERPSCCPAKEEQVEPTAKATTAAPVTEAIPVSTTDEDCPVTEDCPPWACDEAKVKADCGEKVAKQRDDCCPSEADTTQ